MHTSENSEQLKERKQKRTEYKLQREELEIEMRNLEAKMYIEDVDSKYHMHANFQLLEHLLLQVITARTINILIRNKGIKEKTIYREYKILQYAAYTSLVK